MSLKSLKRPPGITCNKFVADAKSSKRCARYLKGGSCDLDTEFLCVEWLKKQHPERFDGTSQQTTDPTGPATNQTGLPDIQPPATPARAKPKHVSPVTTPPGQLRDRERGVAGNLTEQPATLARSEPLGLDRVNALANQEYEVCLEGWGENEVWVVPAYTGKPRVELSYVDMATLRELLVVLPGARVKQITSGPKKGSKGAKNGEA